MKRNIIIHAAVALLLMAATSTAQAKEVTLHQAGTLSQFISASEKYSLSELTVIGPVNGTDIKLIRDMAGCDEQGRTTSGILTILDISGVQIEAGGDAYFQELTTAENTLGSYMFIGTKLSKVVIPTQINTIGSGVFAMCYNLLEIEVSPESGWLESLNGSLFCKKGDGAKLLEYPSGITNESFTVPSTTTRLGDVHEIGNAFMYNDYLKKVEMPATVQTIIDYSFYQSSIEEVIIPASVNSIGTNSFGKCASLTSITSLIEHPFTIGSNVFAQGAATRTLYVPQGTKSAYQRTSGWNVFTDIQELQGALDPVKPRITVPEAGKLAEMLANINTDEVEELIIIGPINGTDIRLIRSMGGNDYMGKPTDGKLRKLDLSNATIVAGGQRYLETSAIENRTTILRGDYYKSIDEADCIGDYMFAGMNVSEIILPQNITILGIASFALCENLKAIALPSSLRKVYDYVFSESSLLAIDWPLNGSIQDFVTAANFTNPNTIFYLKSEQYAPAGFQNIVINGTAERIVLTDGYDFFNLKDFYANSISYQHSYTKISGVGNSAGWETIVLPFSPRTISHETKGTLKPFSSWSEGSTDKPFWLYEMMSGGFTPADGIEANKPYIICMPNNDGYKDEYRVNGEVTFSATNTTVKASGDPTYSIWSYRTFVPAFLTKTSSPNIYAMNDAGSEFVNNRAVTPFSAYITTDGSYTRPTISIFGDGEQPSGIDHLLRSDDGNGLVSIYTLAGKKVSTINAADATSAVNALPTGVYIVGGKKVVK